MRPVNRIIHTVESHTEGMPTRVVVGGVGVIPGKSMFERRAYFLEHMDDLRTLLMYEPRGHSAMSGAILQPSTRPDADWGVLYIEVSGCLPMCGHGTIGVATVLVETGMVEVIEPITTVKLDTPAGLVTVDVQVSGGKAQNVTITNVPSFTLALDQTVKVPGYGEIKYDMAYGGNFYAIVPIERVGIEFKRENGIHLASLGCPTRVAVSRGTKNLRLRTPQPARADQLPRRSCAHSLDHGDDKPRARPLMQA